MLALLVCEGTNTEAMESMYGIYEYGQFYYVYDI